MKKRDTGAPIPDEVERITAKIMEGIGECDLESALTVVCGIAGHLVAAMCEGNLGKTKGYAESMAENIKAAAYAKLMHDDDQRRRPN